MDVIAAVTASEVTVKLVHASVVAGGVVRSRSAGGGVLSERRSVTEHSILERSSAGPCM